MILSLDPGKDKTGWACINQQGTLLGCGIERTATIHRLFSSLRNQKWPENCTFRCADPEPVELVLVGDGTTSKQLLDMLSSDLPYYIVSERGTTEEGYKLYEHIAPPRGVRRLIPAGLRRPPRAIDDMAAWAIGLRWLKTKESIQ